MIVRLLGIAVFVTTATKIHMVLMLKNLPQGWNDLFLFMLVIFFFGSGVLGGLGLIFYKFWGFIGIYIFVPIATMLGISAMPFIVSLLPMESKTYVLIGLNILTLIVSILLNIIEMRKLKNEKWGLG